MTVENHSPVPVYQPGEDWASLLDSADEILGYDLARDESADDLTGVPFLITRVVFRPGMMREKVRQAYVSCEARIAPSLDIARVNRLREASRLPSITVDSLSFGPDAHVVFNDGSTGVYRQVVKYLAAKGFITLNTPVIEAGPFGESSFDQPPSGWADAAHGEIRFDNDGFALYNADIRLFCPRGLRLSLYENDYTQTGKTRYIA